MNKPEPRIIIAVDGFSSCGKSTMAKALARNIGYIYIDSGAMYRAVTLYCLDHGLIDGDTVDTDTLRSLMDDIQIDFRPDPETGMTHTFLNGIDVEREIRSMRVSDKVSPVSAIPFVRTAMVAAQQKMGGRERHRHGRARYRHDRIPPCRTENIRHGLGGDSGTTTRRRTEGERCRCRFRRSGRQHQQTRPHRPDP